MMGSVTTLVIHGVSDGAVRIMKMRAARSGQVLEAYAGGLIERAAANPSVGEAVERASRDATAGIGSAGTGARRANLK
jgi:antitoxin FitA